MRTLLSAFTFALAICFSSASFAQMDSTGAGTSGVNNYGDVIASSTWHRVANKPATATRWPTWNEVTNKPDTFPPAPHHHDSRYLQLDKVAKNCPDGQFVAGIKNNGTLNCQKLPSTGSTSVARPGPYGIREGGGCSSGAQRFCDPFGNCSCRMPGP